MDNRVTDLETSRKLMPIMGGVQGLSTWANVSSGNKGGEKQWSGWHLLPSDCPPFMEGEFIPCYDFLDLLGRLPDIIDVDGIHYSLKLDFACHAMCYHLQGRGTLDGSANFWVENNQLLQAAASLLLWTHEQGFLQGVKG